MSVLEELKAVGHRQGLFLSAVVVAGIFLLIPPAALADRYSILEASLLLLASAALVTRSDARAVPPLAVPTALLALLLLISASTLWSSASWYTLRDSLAYVALAATAWLVVKHGGLQPVLLGVTVAGLLILLATGALWLFDPDAVFYNRTLALQAIYRNRNEFGAVMLQCLPAAMAFRIQVRGGAVLRGVLVVVFLGAIYSSQSKTSMIAALLVVIAWAVFVLGRHSLKYAIAFGVLVLVGVGVAVANLPQVLQLLGKDETFNGRSRIWAGLIDLIPESPVIGFGFFREWPGGSSQSVAVLEASGFPMIHAHNELLSWLSAIGVIGLIVVLALYGFIYWAGWRIHRVRKIEGAIWLLLTMVMINARGLAETSETNPQGWFVFMLVGFACARYVPVTLEKPISKLLMLPLSRRQGSFVKRENIGTEIS